MFFRVFRLFAYLGRVALTAESIGVWNSLRLNFFARFDRREVVQYAINGVSFHVWRKSRYCLMLLNQSMVRLLKDGKVADVKRVLDVGAFVGDTILLLRKQYPQAVVCAIEASPKNYCLLFENFGTDPMVHLMNCGLFSRPGMSLEVFNNSENPMGYQIRSVEVATSPEATIPGITIPEVMAQMGWDSIDLLKMDIEGGELPIFTADCSSWIDKVSAFVFELPDVDSPGATHLIYRALSSEIYESRISGECLVIWKKSLGWSDRYTRWSELD